MYLKMNIGKGWMRMVEDVCIVKSDCASLDEKGAAAARGRRGWKGVTLTLLTASSSQTSSSTPRPPPGAHPHAQTGTATH